MKKTIPKTLIGIAAILFLAIAVSASAAEGIHWYDYSKGMSLGKSQGKKVFISFYADWCTYCRQMEKATFSNAKVIDYLNANFIPIRVNFDREKKTVKAYGVRGLPDTWFIAENGQRIANQPGFLAPEQLLPILKYLKTDSYKTMSFRKFIEAP
jgi:thioredoxin-related protein